MGRVLYDRSDSVLNVWILSWQAHILLRQPLDLFAAPIFFPLRTSLAFSEIIWPAAPLAAPLLAASGNPVLVYNLLYLGSFVLAGLGMFLLARRVVVSPLAALLAGGIYAFSSHQFGHLSQIQLLSIGWLPLVLLALDRLWRLQRPRDGVLLACCIVFQSLSAFYYAFQVALLVGVYLFAQLALAFTAQLAHLPQAAQGEDKTTAGRGAAAALPRLLRVGFWCAVAAAVILPFTLPYFAVRAEFGLQRSLEEALAFSPPLIDYLAPRRDNPLYAVASDLHHLDVGGLFLGVGTTLLALLGLVKWRSNQPREWRRPAASPLDGRWFWLALFASAVLLSLGPQLKLLPDDSGGQALPFQWLFLNVPGFTAIRAPGRFAVGAFLALAVLAAAGTAWLLAHVSRQYLRVALATVLGVVVVAEYAAGLVPVTGKAMPDLHSPPAVATWLAEQPPAVIVELPLTHEMALPPVSAFGSTGPAAAGGAEFARAWPDFNMFRHQYVATVHWQPSVDGFTGFVPPHHRELGLSMVHFPAQRSLEVLRGLGVTYVIVYSQLLDDFQPGRAAGLRQALAASAGVEHVQDFGPDWVYRLLPAPASALTGEFWASEAGDAVLVLKNRGAGAHVFLPTERLALRARWQPADGGRSFEQLYWLTMPLAVSDTSVIPLALSKPDAAGAYTLTVEAQNPAFPLSLLRQQVNRTADGPVPTLAPLRLQAASAPRHTSSEDAITVELRWQVLDRPLSDVSVGLHVLDAMGEKIVNDDQPLSGGIDLVREWLPGMVLTTTHTLALPPPDRHLLTLRAFLYRPDAPDAYLFFDSEGAPVREILLPLELPTSEGS